jgi:hypothetical protein
MLHYMPGDPPSYAWTITAENANSFGVNWLEFQDHLKESRSHEVFTEIRLFNPSGPDGNPVAEDAEVMADALERAGVMPGLWVSAFRLDEVKISIDYYFWHPVLEGLRETLVRAEIRGEARIIPEPASWLLLLVGCGRFLVRRR